MLSVEVLDVYAMLTGKVHKVLQALALGLLVLVAFAQLVPLDVVKLTDAQRLFQRGA